MEEIGKQIAGYGVAGIVLWFLLTRTIPGLVEKFEAALIKVIAAFQAETAAARGETRSERDLCREQHKENMDAHEETHKRLDDLKHGKGQ